MLWDGDTRKYSYSKYKVGNVRGVFPRWDAAAGDLVASSCVDVASRKEIANFQGGRGLFVFSPDGTLLASRAGEGARSRSGT